MPPATVVGAWAVGQYFQGHALAAFVGGAAVTVADDLAPGVLALAERGYCRPLPADETRGPGRKPSPAFGVNPAVYDEVTA
jgi:hypothetical protein